MDRAEIKERLINILKQYTRKQQVWETATDHSSILTDLRINSARFVDLVLDVEDEFGIEIEDSAMDLVLTIQHIVDLLEQKIAEK